MKRRQMIGALTAAAGSALVPGSLGAASAQTPAPTQSGKEKVTGIGGVFFRARDPKALAQWYQEHLGVGPQSASEPSWNQQTGPTSFTPFPETTNYFGDATKQWMLNFRVGNLDKLVKQLEAAGIAVKVDPTAYPYGRFARIHDPEGNPIELWQPVP
jgi:predicted enzyme related to lactoylglutathione lyase